MIPAFTTTYHLLLPACMHVVVARGPQAHTHGFGCIVRRFLACITRNRLFIGQPMRVVISLLFAKSSSYPHWWYKSKRPHPSLPPPTTHNPLVGRTDVMKTPLFYISTLLTVRIRRYLSSNQYIPVKSPLNDKLLICYRLASLVCSFGIPRSWSSTARYRLTDRLLGCWWYFRLPSQGLLIWSICSLF